MKSVKLSFDRSHDEQMKSGEASYDEKFNCEI